jgi:hypothetical protein
MKPTDAKSKLDTQKVFELLGLALVAARDGFKAQAEALATITVTSRFAERLERSVDLVDYATAALAAELGGTVFPGAGGAPSAELTEKADVWIRRGKRDVIR